MAHRLLALCIVALALAACGQPVAAPTPAPTPSPAAPSPAPAAGPPDYAGIPQGLTDEGYQQLGDPAAPVALVMYSDFL